MSIILRLLTSDDISAADELLKVAFHSPASRAAELQRHHSLQPDAWWLATYADQPVGMVGAMDYGALAYMGKMAVHPDFQGQGIGAKLLQQVLSWLETRRTPIVLLDATAAGAPLYERFGFVAEDQAQVFQRTSSALLTMPRGVRALQLADLADLLVFDAPLWGANRLALLQRLYTEDPQRAFIARDRTGRICGYVIAQSQRIGPWVAHDIQAAEALLQAVLTLNYAHPPVVSVPQRNAHAISLMAQYDFRFVQAATHMRRGGAAHPSQRALIYAQTNFVAG